jgi:hypothetical protein
LFFRRIRERPAAGWGAAIGWGTTSGIIGAAATFARDGRATHDVNCGTVWQTVQVRLVVPPSLQEKSAKFAVWAKHTDVMCETFYVDERSGVDTPAHLLLK